MVIRHADFQPIEQLRRDVFKTSVPLRVLLLLPRHFEQDGKGTVIRSSFVQARDWQKLEIPGCDYIRWAAQLEALSSLSDPERDHKRDSAAEIRSAIRDLTSLQRSENPTGYRK